MFSMYLGGDWYLIKAKKKKVTSAPKRNSMLPIVDEVLEPILGITDLRKIFG